MQIKPPTVSIVLDTRREKSNSVYPVKLRVTHLRKQRYWGTGIDLSENQFKEVMAGKPKKAFLELSYKLKAKKRNAENIIDDMHDFSFRQFEIKIGANQKDVQNVFSYYEEYIKELKEDERVGTASNL